MIAPLVCVALNVGAAPPAAGAAWPAGVTTRCCLTHRAYRGVCEVTIGEKETCEDVLAYLNAPNSAGRTYCNSTRLRGGWELVPCPPRATPRPAAASAAGGGEGSTP